MRTQTAKAVFVSIVLLAGVTAVAAQDEQNPAHTLSTSEVKSLLKTANTSEQHMQLADYFRREAQKELDAAALHDQLAATYANAKMTEDVKHCNYFAQNARKAAKNDLKLADNEQKIADALKNAPPTHGFHR